jgi:hypothetical protein
VYIVSPFSLDDVSREGFLLTELTQPIPIGSQLGIFNLTGIDATSYDPPLAASIGMWMQPELGGGECGLHSRDDALCAIFRRLANLNTHSRDTSADSTVGNTRSDRTDFLDGVPIVVLEEQDLNINEAVDDILRKTHWIPNYHTLAFTFGIAISRFSLQILKLLPNSAFEIVFTANLENILERWLCVRVAINIARSLLLFRSNGMIIPSHLQFGTWHSRGQKRLRLQMAGHQIEFHDTSLYLRMVTFYQKIKIKKIPHIEQMIYFDPRKNHITLKPLGIMRKPSSQDEAQLALAQICKALFALHDLGYMHCDLRWSNIIEAFGSWTIIDCEYACHQSEAELRQERSSVIKPEFVLHQGQPWDFSFDLYQVGKLLSDRTVNDLIGDDLKSLRDLILNRSFEYRDIRVALANLLQITL